jgi:deoxyribodipyrimidine photo-lyase
MIHRFSLFLFHRDLRLDDNIGLLAALKESTTVIPVFICTPEQTQNNPYKGNATLQFLHESLIDLDLQLQKKNSRLHVFTGKTLDVLDVVYSQVPFSAVYSNIDYTPFAQKRDNAIRDWCTSKKIPFIMHHDALLTMPGSVLTKQNTPYTVYTPFTVRAKEISVPLPQVNSFTNFYTAPIQRSVLVTSALFAYQKMLNYVTNGGRTVGLRHLRNAQNLELYKEQRDFPALSATSFLGAHHKFGTVSIRETFHTIASLFGSNHTIINELYWRDFFTHVAFFFPHVFSGPFRKEYSAVPWKMNHEFFTAWKEGKTGYPIVDAGMRELYTTGFMHNRVRMITASFLVKHLHIHWQEGERYFATQLLDYDPAVNNGNWQWVASTGCDAQPYFRIFNPWLQQKKFDADCVYIKRFIPELASLSSKEIHNLEHERPLFLTEYPLPIVDHATATQATKLLYACIRH